MNIQLYYNWNWKVFKMSTWEVFIPRYRGEGGFPLFEHDYLDINNKPGKHAECVTSDSMYYLENLNSCLKWLVHSVPMTDTTNHHKLSGWTQHTLLLLLENSSGGRAEISLTGQYQRGGQSQLPPEALEENPFPASGAAFLAFLGSSPLSCQNLWSYRLLLLQSNLLWLPFIRILVLAFRAHPDNSK